MAMFVHITAAKYGAGIRRSGLGGSKANLFGGRWRRDDVFCFPVVESHTLTHQWVREIQKWRRQPLVGVYFRVSDDEMVTLRRGDQRPRTITAAQAFGIVRACESMEGFEVVVKRRIAAKEIHRIAPVRGVIGWRHSPDSHGRKPCACEICQKGQPSSRRIMRRAERGELQGWFLDVKK